MKGRNNGCVYDRRFELAYGSFGSSFEYPRRYKRQQIQYY